MTAVSNVLRVALAVAMALSWLLLTGAPASAIVTRAAVESPGVGAKLAKAKPLKIVVERAPAEEDPGQVRTRLLYGGNPPTPAAPDPSRSEAPEDEEASQQQEPTAESKPVSKKVIDLVLTERKSDGGAGERMRFEGVIDPYQLAWLDPVGVAANGKYTLEYRHTQSDWQRYEFRIDAPPPATSAPGVAVTDPADKQMTVAWQAHPVPDLSHYVVERRLDGGDWKVAIEKVDPKTTQVEDTLPKYGSYVYRIRAVRPAGDGSNEMRTAVSPQSGAVQIQKASTPGDGGDSGSGTDTGTGDGTGTGGSGGGSDTSGSTSTSAPPPLPSSGSTQTNPSMSSQDSGAPDVAFPRGFDDTYKGPLDYNVEQREVTERVPIDIAEGGSASDSTLRVLDRAIDQTRVLPPVAGGLILVVSAAHVLRYLNE